MKSEDLFLAISLVAFVFSVVFVSFSYFTGIDLISQITGYQVGEANLTVETLAQVNFSVRAISWGSGRVGSSFTAASLTTSNHTGVANVTNGNWTLDSDPGTAGFQASGLVIENIGTVNVTLNLSVGKNASEFIGGTNPAYEWNLTNLNANSCLNSSGLPMSVKINSLFPANTTTRARIWCDVFPFRAAQDAVRIDFNLTIPDDSLTGALGDTVTATVTAL